MTFQYQRLADQLAHKIYQHELQPQQKLSSLREFARQQSISLSTAQQCYELLEAKGLIYVKAKSGYFVSSRQYQSAAPKSPSFESKARQVSNLDLQNQIQTASIQNHLTPLGAIQLSPHLIPVDGLRRSLQRALKHCQPEDFLYCNKQGHEQLRKALSDHWREDGIFIAAEDIFITLNEISRENWSFGEGKSQAVIEKREKNPFTAGNSGVVILNRNPVLDSYTRDILFGKVWMDETLDQKTRSVITLTALAAIGNTEQMKFHIQTAHKNGVKREELIALTTHLAFYIGWPQAVQLLNQITDDFKYNPEF